jgi:hypothetical protein
MTPPAPESTGHKLAVFMATSTGRLIRIVLGLALIVIGLWGIGDTAGWIIAIIGLVPLAAGAANVCLIAPLLGEPLRGTDL